MGEKLLDNTGDRQQLPGSPVPGILQARTLEWVAIAFSNAWISAWSTTWSVSVSRLTTAHSADLKAPTQPSDKRLSATWEASVSNLIRAYQPLDQYLSASWSAPVSHFNCTSQPIYQHKASISVPRSSPTAHLICVYLYSPMSCVQYCTILGVPVTL